MQTEPLTNASATMPDGPAIRGKLSRDDLLMRGGMIVIAAYLLITLVMPLFVMFSKSLSTYRFDLAAFEFQVSDEAGQFDGPVLTGAELNAQTGAYSPDDLNTNSDGRLSVTAFFPDFCAASAVAAATAASAGSFLICSLSVIPSC